MIASVKTQVAWRSFYGQIFLIVVGSNHIEEPTLSLISGNTIQTFLIVVGSNHI